MKFTLSVKIFPGTGDAPHIGLPAEFPFGSHFTSHASHFGCERAELVDHRIDRVLQLKISPFTSTVIFFERSPLATAVVTSAILRTWTGQVTGHRIH